MRKSTTYMVDLERLQRAPASELVVALLVAMNDVSLINSALASARQDADRMTSHRRAGVARYWLLLQSSQVFEALAVLERLRSDGDVRQFVSRSTRTTIDGFRQVQTYLDGGRNRGDLEKYIQPLRNRVVFHYDHSVLARALKGLAAYERTRLGSVTIGTTADMWRFNFVDDLVEAAIADELWRVPQGTDPDTFTGDAVQFCYQVGGDIVGFGMSFGQDYLHEFARPH